MLTRNRRLNSIQHIKQEPNQDTLRTTTPKQIKKENIQPDLVESNNYFQTQLNKLKNENEKAKEIIQNLSNCLNDLKNKIELERETNKKENQRLNHQLRRLRNTIKTDQRKIQLLKTKIRKLTAQKIQSTKSIQTVVNTRCVPFKFKNILNEYYLKNKYPKQEDFNEMIQKTNLTKIQLNEWFKNKRKRTNQIRLRVIIKSNVKAILIRTYNKNKNPAELELKKLKSKTGLNLKQLKDWFHNRRRNLNDYLRARTKYSLEVLSVLNEKFRENNYPTNEEFIELSGRTGHNVEKLKNWFKNKRRNI